MQKRPRHYADEFLEAEAAGDKEKRDAALAGCPKDWRELVRKHIVFGRMVRAGIIRRKQKDGQ